MFGPDDFSASVANRDRAAGGTGRDCDAADRSADRAADRLADRAEVVADLRRKIGRVGGIDGRSAWAAVTVGDGIGGSARIPSPNDISGAVASPGLPGAAGTEDPAPGSRAAEFGTTAPGTLPVPAPLAGLLPRGGLARGSVVSLGSVAPGRSGITSLLLSLLAASREGWTAVVGLPDFGVLAAAELGVNLDRLALIPDPGSDVLQVLSLLMGGVDVIATAPPKTLPPARQRVLTGRLRQCGAVLMVVGRWPGADVTMTVQAVRWSGIGQGHGRLRDREIDIEVGGRRIGGGSRATVLLRSTRSAVVVEQGGDIAMEGAADGTRDRFAHLA